MGDVTLRPATAADLEQWNDVVEQSPEGTPFHRLEWLRAIETVSGERFAPLVGEARKGLVGVLPLFEKGRMGLTLLTSPPAKSLIQALGPLVVHSGAGTVDDERMVMSFLEPAFRHLAARGARTLVSIKARLPLGGARAATWSGFRVTPVYTYGVPLDRPADEVVGSFATRARRSVRDAERLGLTLRASAEHADALRIYALISARYHEQGMRAPYSERYLEAFWTAAAPQRLAALCVERDGEFVTGMLVAHQGETLFCISGAPRMEVEGVSVNEFLHARAMGWARDQGVRWYDLVGANTPRLLEFKRKLRPVLRESYLVESDSFVAWSAKRLYQGALR